ncbi:MAG TPA: hypothetical protein DGT21_22430 [Armatimonadetes bacterium]|nr:hypothetical protein [Armatimonadota bacterium]
MRSGMRAMVLGAAVLWLAGHVHAAGVVGLKLDPFEAEGGAKLFKATEVLDNLPAALAGVRVGDTITHVDGRAIAGMTLKEVVDLIRGDPGTAVALTVVHEGEQTPVDIRIWRARVNEQQMAVLGGKSATVDFDLRPLPAPQLRNEVGGTVAQSVASGDGLELGLSDDGRVVSVQVDGVELAGGETPPLAGLFVWDAAAKSELMVVRGGMTPIDGGLHTSGHAEGLDLAFDADWTAHADHLAVDVTVRNERAGDRAITVYFALPYPEGEPVWWDDLDTARPADARVTLGNFFGPTTPRNGLETLTPTTVGANGQHSRFPLGCVTGDQGLALAIPMDYPIYHRIAASGDSGQLYLAVDLALTEATTKFPNEASYSLVMYRCDEGWGLRAALQKYYAIFPEQFEKRMEDDGGCWTGGALQGMINLEELGVRYHWGDSDVAYDDQMGIYSFIYNDAPRYLADLGQYQQKPSAADAVTRMQALLDAPDPRAHILDVRPEAFGRKSYEGRERWMGRRAGEAWLRAALAAVRTSAMLGADERVQVGYVINRQEFGGADWWTGRALCNVDPDIPGGYGQFLFNRVLGMGSDPMRTQGGFKHSRAVGAQADGVGIDNYFVNGETADFDRAHLAACDFPATYAHDDLRPVVLGDTAMYEWVRELQSRLAADGLWVAANTASQPYFPFAYNLMDIVLLEWGLEKEAAATRMLIYHKPLVTSPRKPEFYREAFVKSHLPMAAMPGGYGQGAFLQPADRYLAPGTPAAALYAKYVPIILRMQGAGWEPLTWATADSADVSVERFGSALPLLLSLHNHADAARSVTVSVEMGALGIAASSARDLVQGMQLPARVEADMLLVKVTLPAWDKTVIELRADGGVPVTDAVEPPRALDIWEKPGTRAAQEIAGPGGLPLVWVPGGSFMMGSTNEQVRYALQNPNAKVESLANEQPAHQVALSGFWLGKTEVTVAQWRAVMGSVPGTSNDRGDSHPVVEVGWGDANLFCQRLGLKLPTEAQWEYAARGPESLQFPWGNEWDAERVCWTGNKGPGGKTFPVGSFPSGASWCGALDMAGNAWEWCADWWDKDYYKSSPVQDPPGPNGGGGHALRGGSWGIDSSHLRSASRGYGGLAAKSPNGGFRVAVSVP